MIWLLAVHVWNLTATHSWRCQDAMHTAHRLWPQVSQTRREHWNILSCEGEHDLLQELGSIQPDPRNLVVRRKAADAVSEAAGSVPDASHLLGTMWTLALSPDAKSFFCDFLSFF